MQHLLRTANARGAPGRSERGRNLAHQAIFLRLVYPQFAEMSSGPQRVYDTTLGTNQDVKLRAACNAKGTALGSMPSDEQEGRCLTRTVSAATGATT